MVGDIFALMRVGTREYKRRKMFASHHLAEGFKSLSNSHIHLFLSFRDDKGTKLLRENDTINTD